MTKKQVIAGSIIEVAIQAIAGGLVGGILGCLLFYPTFQKIEELFSISSGEWGIADCLLVVAGGILIALLVSLCAAAIPAIHNAKIDPQNALAEGELV